MNSFQFSNNAWSDYLYWVETNKKTVIFINKLLKDISRNGNIGMGHPEQLKGRLSGYYSRHIDKKNRLIYKIEKDIILIYSCKGHYEDK